jgi:hypothetical protein
VRIAGAWASSGRANQWGTSRPRGGGDAGAVRTLTARRSRRDHRRTSTRSC